MKIVYNLTTESEEDLARFESREDFLDFSSRFDGVELMYFGEDERGIIPKDKVIGFHLRSFITWLDLWRGDHEALACEFGSLDVAREFYGSLDPEEAILQPFRTNIAQAHAYGAEYMVFHISENYLDESFTFRYSKSDEEVIDAACEVINELLKDEDGSVAFLMENLWEPGLNFRNMAMAQRLLDGVRYDNKGIMFDTGHLMHTDFSVETPEQGLALVNAKIDEMDAAGITPYIRGMHLQQGPTGAFCRELVAQEHDFSGQTYQERSFAAWMNAYKIDKHEPFVAEGVEDMISRLPLEYLNFENITSDREQLKAYHDAQWAVLPNLARGRA